MNFYDINTKPTYYGNEYSAIPRRKPKKYFSAASFWENNHSQQHHETGHLDYR